MQFAVPHDHPSLPGHFPGRPIVPGVLVLDHVLAAIEASHGPTGGLRLPQVKFASPLRPGEHARIALEGDGPRWRFRVLRDDGPRGEVLVASGEVVSDALVAGEGTAGQGTAP